MVSVRILSQLLVVVRAGWQMGGGGGGITIRMGGGCQWISEFEISMFVCFSMFGRSQIDAFYDSFKLF